MSTEACHPLSNPVNTCETRRKTYERLIQCRTGRHAFVGEYFSSFVPLGDPSCPCGEPFQTREHVIASCPTYESKRDIPRSASDLVVTDLLGTEKGIEALIEFLNETDAFKKLNRANPNRTDLQLPLPSE
ncbi:hypothetical protein EDD16DRAFT_1472646 [Pisolithus croceorrhizus]|nr:hypothetical protein EDD16DRAFT_1472646 [Pisolithus croceorrhizus]KAI6165211.1 hypothetical protein EDD17DRAFT_1690769 [Pisolithus thermaeus]